MLDNSFCYGTIFLKGKNWEEGLTNKIINLQET